MQTRYESLSPIEFAALAREEQRAILREHEALRSNRLLADAELDALLEKRVGEILERLRLAGRLEEFQRYAARRRQRLWLPAVPWSWTVVLVLVALAIFLIRCASS